MRNTLVHCRTGSLEKSLFVLALKRLVHCRTGSLETYAEQYDQQQ